MNFFSFFLSGRLFICPSILNVRSAGQSNLGCRSPLLMTLNISCQPLLACKVSFEKSADSLLGTPQQVSNCFSLAAFKTLSLSLTFVILIMMCPGVHLFGFILFGTLCASWTFLHQITEIFFHYFFQISNFLLFLFSFWHPYEVNVGMLEVVPDAAYTILIFMDYFFFLF